MKLVTGAVYTIRSRAVVMAAVTESTTPLRRTLLLSAAKLAVTLAPTDPALTPSVRCRRRSNRSYCNQIVFADNHMDYSSDLCKTGGWTPGQIARMQQQMSIYRHL